MPEPRRAALVKPLIPAAVSSFGPTRSADGSCRSRGQLFVAVAAVLTCQGLIVLTITVGSDAARRLTQQVKLSEDADATAEQEPVKRQKVAPETEAPTEQKEVEDLFQRLFIWELPRREDLDLSAYAPFVMNNSVGQPFFILTEGGLVDGMPTPDVSEFDRLRVIIEAWLFDCEKRGAVLIADFEGELPGYGGELVTAAFQETDAVDQMMSPRTPPAGVTHFPGLLLDLRNPFCVNLLRRIMDSESIVKLIWGADGDLQSLMYQHQPVPLQVTPSAVVDVQLAFSDASRRLGMKRMLERVPQARLNGLPAKEQIDFDSFHARNQRSMPLPLSHLAATYALDDLHRIEMILVTQSPPAGSYERARDETENMTMDLRQDPEGFQALQRNLQWLRSKEWGARKIKQAVEIKRHIMSVRLRGLNFSANEPTVEVIEREAEMCLQSAGVMIPDDLSFAIGNGAPFEMPPPLGGHAPITGRGGSRGYGRGGMTARATGTPVNTRGSPYQFQNQVRTD